MNLDSISQLNVFLTQRQLCMADVSQKCIPKGKAWECEFSITLDGVQHRAVNTASAKKAARKACAAALLANMHGSGSAASSPPAAAAAASAPAAAAAAGVGNSASPASQPRHPATLAEYCTSLGSTIGKSLKLSVYRGKSSSGPPLFKAKGHFTHPTTRQEFSHSAIRESKAAARAAMEEALLQDVLFETAGAPAAEAKAAPPAAEAIELSAPGAAAAGTETTPNESLPLYAHGREVIETADVDTVAAWVHPIVQALGKDPPRKGAAPVATVGFDTEWHGFKGVGSPTVILQLAAADSVLIVHTLHMHQQLQGQRGAAGAASSSAAKLLSPLGRALPGLLVLLTHPGVVKVGRSMNNDAAGMIALFSGDLPRSFKCNAEHGYVDATANTTFKVSTGAPALVASVLGRFYKKQVTSWRAKWRFPLSPKELEYVADDACIPFDVRAAVLEGAAQ